MKPRIFNIGWVFAGGLALCALASGQAVPEKFVVSGKAAEQLMDFNTINLATAQKLTETCEALVSNRNGGHTIIVLDHDGNHVYLDRMDGLGYTNIVTAEMKARTALLGKRPSKYYMNQLERDTTTIYTQNAMSLYAVAGGLPIIINKQLIGAIGVGGFGPNPPVWSDEICARTSLEQVLGMPQPALLEDLPAHHASPGRLNATATPKPSVPAEFVIGAKGNRVFDANQIALAAAKKIGSGCRDWAAAKNATMSLYVLDTAGEMIHMERMDGQGPLAIKSALLKAQTSLRLREATSQRWAEVKSGPHDPSRSSAIYNFFLEPGGLPIVVDGQMIGAVGVGGLEANDGTGSPADEACAVAGLKAAFGEHVALPSAGPAAPAQKH
jgi:uncharacterized protein GlcG (DUF336 family)